MAEYSCPTASLITLPINTMISSGSLRINNVMSIVALAQVRGIFSGTLTYILNRYDLAGIDVARKVTTSCQVC